MTEHIANMVRRGDSESIQRYVKTHLPSDQASLERIYRELVRDGKQEGLKKPQKERTARSNSEKTLQNGAQDRAKGHQQRTKGLMKLLREKGFKAAGNDQDQGRRIFQQQRGKLVRPLITNSKLLQGGQAGIDRLIERYNANSDYYCNNIEDVNIDISSTVDRQMREFIDRRQAVLSSLQRSQHLAEGKSNRYAAVPSKVTQNTTRQRQLSSRELPTFSRRSSRLSMQQLQSKGLMQSCQRQIEAKRFKQVVVNRNDFGALQRRLSGDLDQEELDIGKVINLAKVREKMSSEQYERYTHSYMKMMTNKNQEGSKCKLNPYAKQLLQDQRKMRNIIDFSQK